MYLQYLPLCLLMVLGACAAPTRSKDPELALLAREHDEQLSRFQAEQVAFHKRTKLPQRQEFPSLGTLIVDQAALVGRPGKAWVRANFTFINSSSIGFEGVQVTLYVTDPDSGERWAESLQMQEVIGLRPAKESTYTAAIRADTHGVEFKPGWQWELVLENVKESG